MILENAHIRAQFSPEEGWITGLYSALGPYNLADKRGFGGIRYTLQTDDITTDAPFVLYKDRKAGYTACTVSGDTAVCEILAWGSRRSSRWRRMCW